MQRHIVFIRLQGVDLLAAPGEAQPYGSCGNSNSGHRPIIKALAHPQPVAAPIKADQRDEDEVQMPDLDSGRPSRRLGDAKPVRFGLWRHLAELERVSLQYGEITTLAVTPGGGEDWRAVDFAVERRVERNVSGFLVPGRFGDERGDRAGRSGVLFGCLGAPEGPQAPAEVQNQFPKLPLSKKPLEPCGSRRWPLTDIRRSA